MHPGLNISVAAAIKDTLIKTKRDYLIVSLFYQIKVEFSTKTRNQKNSKIDSVN